MQTDFPLIPVDEFKDILESLPESKGSNDFQNLYLEKGEDLLEEPSHRSVSKKNDTKLSWGVVRERQIKMLLGAYKKKKSPAHRNALLKWAYKPDDIAEAISEAKDEALIDEDAGGASAPTQKKTKKAKKEDLTEAKVSAKTSKMLEVLESIANGIKRIESTLGKLQIHETETETEDD